MLKSITSILLTIALITTMLIMGAPAMAESYKASTTLSGSSSAKIDNVKLAAKAINGARVNTNGTFSFNETVGPRTKDRGYVTAMNGRGAKVVGGGVSQVATTLYLALKKLGDDVRFSGLKTYGSKFADNYLSSGRDAVITDYRAGTDLYFRNLGRPFTISMRVQNKKVVCTLVFEDDDDDDTGYIDETFDDDDDYVDWFFAPGVDSFHPVTADLLASSSLTCKGGSGTMNNIRLAAASIYDTTLKSGAIFSFNSIVGPRKEVYGYATGLNGRGSKVIGGGVGQVASVIWLAVRDLEDIAMIEKSTYGSRYNQSYVRNSSDAIVVDTSSGTDFSFRYTGDGSITFYVYEENGVLNCEIYHN